MVNWVEEREWNVDFLWSVVHQGINILDLDWDLVKMCGLVKSEAPSCAHVAIILII